MQFPITPTDNGSLQESALATVRAVLAALGLPLHHPNIDAIYPAIRTAIDSAYLLGRSGVLDEPDATVRSVPHQDHPGEALWIRYLPTDDQIGDVPVSGEVGPYIQPPEGELRKKP